MKFVIPQHDENKMLDEEAFRLELENLRRSLVHLYEILPYPMKCFQLSSYSQGVFRLRERFNKLEHEMLQ